MKLRKWPVLAVAAAVLYAGGHGEITPAAHASPSAAKAITYARAQIGKPYLWGATGPDAFDCSGLVYAAYRKSIARTSQDQWATGRHVSGPRPGDLVFYPGADGTRAAPGHVALVVGGGKMIEAYATGYPVREVPIRPGAVGFTDPSAGGSA